MTISFKSTALRSVATIAFGPVGRDTESMQKLWKSWEEATGHTVEIITMPRRPRISSASTGCG